MENKDSKTKKRKRVANKKLVTQTSFYLMFGYNPIEATKKIYHSPQTNTDSKVNGTYTINPL